MKESINEFQRFIIKAIFSDKNTIKSEIILKR